jgi:hypothetical protein
MNPFVVKILQNIHLQVDGMVLKGQYRQKMHARQAHILGLTNARATIPEWYRNSHI